MERVKRSGTFIGEAPSVTSETGMEGEVKNNHKVECHAGLSVHPRHCLQKAWLWTNNAMPNWSGSRKGAAHDLFEFSHRLDLNLPERCLYLNMRASKPAPSSISTLNPASSLQIDFKLLSRSQPPVRLFIQLPALKFSKWYIPFHLFFNQNTLMLLLNWSHLLFSLGLDTLNLFFLPCLISNKSLSSAC